MLCLVLISRNFSTLYAAPFPNIDKQVFNTKSRLKLYPVLFRLSNKSSISSSASSHDDVNNENSKSDLPRGVPPEFALIKISTISSSVYSSELSTLSTI
ncbi:hypothetical protein D3C87_1317860 [compost metagenome]